MTSTDETLGGSALITGAAHGIGAAFAQRLAASRKRLILVDRDEAALASMPELLKTYGPAEVELLPADLARTADQDAVVRRIEQEPDMDLLINNAGFNAPTWFHEQSHQIQVDMLNVHVVSTVRFCRAAVPVMSKRGRGDIINVSALAAFLPGCGGIMYCSTKEFIRDFSVRLRAAYIRRGVTVQLLYPGYTRTGFHSTPLFEGQDTGRVPGWMWQSSDAVARASLRAIERGTFCCVPGLQNQLIRFVLTCRLVPKWLIRRLLV